MFHRSTNLTLYKDIVHVKIVHLAAGTELIAPVYEHQIPSETAEASVNI